MAGQIHNMIQTVITQKAKGNVVIANSIRTKMYLKGVAVDKSTLPASMAMMLTEPLV